MKPKIDPKCKKNGIKKLSDLKTKLEVRPIRIGPRKVARLAPLAHPHFEPDRSRKQRKNGRKEEVKKGRKDEKWKIKSTMSEI